jgi:serine/threonine protein kinase
MEYFNNGDLENYMNNNNNLDLIGKLKILKDIAEGIEYLHENEIIHRDLKPGNIFISLNEETKELIVKVGDFGLSLMNDLKTNHTFCGTQGYMVFYNNYIT